MKKYFFLFLMIFLTGCGGEVGQREQVKTGMIGTDEPVSRKMAAKTIALAFYTNDELEKLVPAVESLNEIIDSFSYFFRVY